MKKNPLNLVTQELWSFDCWLCCTQMISEQLFDCDTETIKKSLHVYKNIGTFLPQIGCFFLNKQCNVELVGLNPHLFTVHDIWCSQSHCKDRIEDVYQKLLKRYIGIKRFPKFMQAWWIIKPILITNDVIESALDLWMYIITNLTDCRLYNKWNPNYNFHFVCISWYDKEYFFVHDPLSLERLIQPYHPIKKEKLLYAIHAAAYWDVDNACCLFISKK